MQPPAAKASGKPPARAIQAARRTQLVEAAIEEIGARGSLDVTVARIAARAGVSPALAFHYFGDKDQIFLTAMRHVLSVFGEEVRARQSQARDSQERLDAIIESCFSEVNFRPAVVTAWLNFYVLANRSREARRLLTVYHRRLHSNLLCELRGLAGPAADAIARRIAGLIDGLYLRFAELSDGGTTMSPQAHVRAVLDHELAAVRGAHA